MSSSVTKLLYVGDPMCSWCWGFAPEIEELAQAHDVEVVVGGLRPGPAAQPLDDRLAATLRHHWDQVAERSGQPFDTSFLDRRDGWVYDTEPAAVAVTRLREIRPTETLDYFTSVQRAFYAEGRDVTDFEVLAEIAGAHEIDPGEFASALGTEEARKRAWADFSQARQWGITGFPTLVGELDDGRLALLARGWTKTEAIESRIASLIEARPA